MKIKPAVFSLMILILALAPAACGSATAQEPVTSTGVSATPTLPPTTEAVTDHVVFKDPVLEKGVRAVLKKPTGDISAAEAATLKELELSIDFGSPEGMMIKDLTGLERFVNLEHLGLQFHAITDIRPLAGLANLKGLGLGGNRIADITPLAGLAKLDFLSIFNCEATDYSPLENLASMRVLFIGYSKIADVGVLSGMKGLEQLQLGNTPVSDVSPLAGLTNLKSLELKGAAVTDFSPLKSIYPNLKEKDFELN